MLKPISLQLDERLLVRVDEVRGDVPRQRWIARVLERELYAKGGPVLEPDNARRAVEHAIEPELEIPVSKSERIRIARGLTAQPRPLIQKKR